MSFEKAIGLEYNSMSEFDSYTYFTTTTAYPRTGTYSMINSANHNHRAGILVTERDEYYFQMAVRVGTTLPGATPGYEDYILQWLSGATILGCVTVDQYGILRAYVGDKGDTLAGTGSTVLPTGTYAILQVYIKVADSGGVLQVKLNNSVEIDFSGDTQSESAAEIGEFKVCSWYGGTSATSKTYYDDIVIFNALGSRCNSWPNGVPVYVMRPNAPGGYSEWTPSAGDNYQCVDEVPPSGTDYVYTNTNDKKDSYNFPDANAALASGVTAIIADYWGQSVGAPSISQIKRLVCIGSVDYEGSGITLEPTFYKHTDVMELNPDDSQPWEKSDLDAIELGMTSLT